jgi:hypothetical protein
LERGDLAEAAIFKVDGKYFCRKDHDHLYPARATSKLRLSKEVLVLGHLLHTLRVIDDNCEQWIWDCGSDCTRKKPDKLWVIAVDDKRVGLHLEIDEGGKSHEDDDTRVADIQQGFDCDELWLIRFNPDKGRNDPQACMKVRLDQNGDRVYKRVKVEFDRRMDVLTSTVLEVYNRILDGEEPTEETWKTMLFF